MRGTLNDMEGSMYTVAVLRDFTAKHFLIGGDWGAENELHSHDYRLECAIQGENLNAHGYLVDIVEIENALDGVLQEFASQVLNHLPEFEGMNPSLEHFCRLLADKLARRIPLKAGSILRIKLWENQFAWASYQMEVTVQAGHADASPQSS